MAEQGRRRGRLPHALRPQELEFSPGVQRHAAIRERFLVTAEHPLEKAAAVLAPIRGILGGKRGADPRLAGPDARDERRAVGSRCTRTPREAGEGLGAFLRRQGADRLIALLKADPTTGDLMVGNRSRPAGWGKSPIILIG